MREVLHLGLQVLLDAEIERLERMVECALKRAERKPPKAVGLGEVTEVSEVRAEAAAV